MTDERRKLLNIRTQLMVANQAIHQALIYTQDVPPDQEVHCILSDAHITEVTDTLRNAINEMTKTYQFKNPW